MTVTLGVYGASGASGWTSFTNLNEYTIIYVASATSSISPVGNDSTGDGSLGAPYATLEKVCTVTNGLQNYGANVKVAVLLRMGDRFTGVAGAGDGFGVLRASGVLGSYNGTKWSDSTSYSGSPIIFSSYDTTLPILTYGVNPIQSTLAAPFVTMDAALNGGFFVSNGGGAPAGSGDCFVVVGIDLYCGLRDGNNVGGAIALPAFNSFYNASPMGLVSVTGTTFILIEDCDVSYGFDNIDINTSTSPVIRRCKASHAFATHHASGMDSNTCTDFVFEENVFDHNGWTTDQSPTVPVQGEMGACHNFYFQSDCSNVIIRGNLTTRDCAAAQIRPSGAYVFDNCWAHNPVPHGLFTPSLGTTNSSVAYRNCYINADDFGGTVGSTNRGLEFSNHIDAGGFTQANLGSISVTDNIFSNATGGIADCALRYNVGVSGQWNNNIVYKWGDNPFQANAPRGLSGTNVINAPSGGGLRSLSLISQGSGWSSSTTYEPIVVADGTAPHNGTLGELKITTNGSGIINSLLVWNHPQGSGDIFFMEAGHDYAVGETIGTSDTSPTYNVSSGLSGITGFKCTITEVSLMTQTGNTVDTTGTSGSPTWYGGISPAGNPNNLTPVGGWDRTLATYDQYTGGIGTSDNFIARAKTNRKQNWNTALTAAGGINPYIREGFGISTSTASTQSPTTSVRGNSKHKKQFFYH